MTERMTVPGLMTDKMTAWSKMAMWCNLWSQQWSWLFCGATYEVSNDPGFFGARLSFQQRVELKAAISVDLVTSVICCHPNAVVFVISHMSPMMPMLTITNRDQTRQKKLLSPPNQSLSSGPQYRFGQAKQCWYFCYLQCCEYVWVGHVVLMVLQQLIKRRRNRTSGLHILVTIAQKLCTCDEQVHSISTHTKTKRIEHSNTNDIWYHICYKRAEVWFLAIDQR